jgi:RNA recognition motif-containing protein
MAMSLMKSWSRSQNFYAVILLLSPTFSAGLRTAPYSFNQIRFNSEYSQHAVTKRCAVPAPADIYLDSDEGVPSTEYKRGQSITFSIVRFGPMGASVTIDDNRALGLVLMKEIQLFRDSRDGMDVRIGEILDGYVERVRDDGKIDVSIRPLGASRITVVRQLVLDALEGSPEGSIPVGDKSSPEDIASYFHGISKKDFKNAIGALYKEGLIVPGGLMVSQVPDGDVDSNRINAEATKKASADLKKPPRLPSDRDSTRSVFIGNLPNKVARDDILKLIVKTLGKDAVTDLRLSLDENKRSRGYGYIELKEESLVEGAIKAINGLELGGRILRSDYADPSRKQEGVTTTPSSDETSDEVQPRKKILSIPSDKKYDSTSPGSWEEGYKVPSLIAAPVRVSLPAPNASGTKEVKAWAKLERPLGNNGMEEGGKSWVKEAERSLQFRKPTSPSSYAYGTVGSSRRGAKPAATLFIGNLANEVDEKILQYEVEKFSGPGTVASVRFPADRDTGKKKGFAYVDIYRESDAKNIYERMHGCDIMGRACNIDDATRS